MLAVNPAPEIFLLAVESELLRRLAYSDDMLARYNAAATRLPVMDRPALLRAQTFRLFHGQDVCIQSDLDLADALNEIETVLRTGSRVAMGESVKRIIRPLGPAACTALSRAVETRIGDYDAEQLEQDSHPEIDLLLDVLATLEFRSTRLREGLAAMRNTIYTLSVLRTGPPDENSSVTRVLKPGAMGLY